MSEAGKNFMELTKYKYLSESDQSKRMAQPPLETEYELSVPGISLPSSESFTLGKVPLIDIIDSRESLRKYSNLALTLEELSYLLWCTQGVKKNIRDKATFRTVPSAGARHAFETFLLINNVQGLQPGLYRYSALQHKLYEVDMSADIKDRITAGCLGQGMVGLSAVTFIWAAVSYRMTWRYVERGYRYLHLDAGHVCQNLYLAAEGIDSGVCAIGAFDDDVINEILGLDGVEQFVIYAASVGKK